LKVVEAQSTNDLQREAIADFKQGSLAPAEDLCRQTLALDPRNSSATHLLGMIAYKRGLFPEAVRSMRRSITLDRNNAYYHSNLGGALHAQRKFVQASVCYKRATLLMPTLVEVHYNRGNLFRDLGRTNEAAAAYQKALALNPRLLEAWNNLGNIFREQGNLDDAAICCTNALAINESCAEATSNLGNIFRDHGKPDKAIIQYRRAIDLNPQLVEAHYNLANVLQTKGDLEAAARGYHLALSLKPNLAAAHYGLGYNDYISGKPAPAILHYQRAIHFNPNFGKAKLAAALAELVQGNYATGWKGYESRWQSDDHDTTPRNYPQPLWNGKALSSGSVLIWGEQGIGDEIMFAGMVPEALNTQADCILECNHRLRPLFARSFPGLKVVSHDSPLQPTASEITAQIPSGSLPRLFRTSYSNFFFGRSPYLIADATQAAHFRHKYGDGQLLVGLAWYSNNPKSGGIRSIDLATLRPLTQLSDVRWISLQYGDHASLQADADSALMPVFIDQEVNQIADLDTFAAQIAALDLVITIDNSTAHLAGALGIPTWLLLPTFSDWRWLQHRPETPWYPTMRLFHQTRPGDWDPVIQQVNTQLQALLSASATLP
jgi:tetratricopeptide (TPR) repeat protein